MACETDCDATEAGFNAATACIRLKTRACSRPRLPGAVNAIFEAGQLLGADRATGVEFAGGDADLGAEAELAAVGELRRGVVQHDRGIDLVEEFLRGGGVFGHDRIGVMRAVIVNMRDRLVEAIDDARRDDGVLVFGVPVFFGSRLYPAVGVLHGGGLIFPNENDPNAKLIKYWISHPAPLGQDEFSTAAYTMFTPNDPVTGTCNTQ